MLNLTNINKIIADIHSELPVPVKPAPFKNKPKAKLNKFTKALMGESDFTTETEVDLRSALAVIPSDDRVMWVAIGQALKTIPVDAVGFNLWDEFSKKSDKYNEADAIAKWQSFNGEKTNYKSVFTKAQELGWSNPKSKQALMTGAVEGELVNDAPAEIAKVNSCFVWDKEQMMFYNIATGIYVKRADILNHYASCHINIGDSEKPCWVELGKLWITHTARKNVTRIVLEPNSPFDLKDGSLNAWRSFPYNPIKGDVSPFLELFKHVVEDPADHEYTMCWIAYAVKFPGVSFKTALLAWSRESGTGKNLLFEVSIAGLFDRRHVETISQTEVDDNFTDWQVDKLFVVADEVSSSGNRVIANKLKRWVDGIRNRINPKGFKAFTQLNLVKYVFLSNNPDAVFLNDSDRRFYVIKASENIYSDVRASRYVDWLNSGGYEAILEYLLNYDTGNFSPKARAPSTLAKVSMIETTRSDIECWVIHRVSIELARGNLLVSVPELAEFYQNSTHKPVSHKAVSLALNSCGAKSLTKRARLADGSVKSLFALRGFTTFNALEEKILGVIYGNYVFNNGIAPIQHQKKGKTSLKPLDLMSDLEVQHHIKAQIDLWCCK